VALAEAELSLHLAGARNVSRRFRAVCLDDDRRLTLIRHRGNATCIQPDRHRHEMVLQPAAIPTDRRGLHAEFQATASPGDVGYSLEVAAWSDGSRAVLDSRGMLHLKSSDAAIPELTLVLCDGALAGWCADGRWFGPAYFIGEHVATRGAVIYEEILRPFLARLR
jgi:hypothetical protein